MKIWTSGVKYKGSWFQGFPQGFGRIDQGPNDWYIGNFFKGYQNGEGERHFVSGDFYKGTWENDKINGFGTMKYVKFDHSLPRIAEYSGQWESNK